MNPKSSNAWAKVAAWWARVSKRGTGYRSLDFIIPTRPVPCPRPRFTRAGHTYYAEGYEVWRHGGDEWAGACAFVPTTEPLLEGPLLCVVDSVMQLPRTVERDFPQYDVDNYAKSVLDLITKSKRVWKDDEQVTALISSKRFVEPGEDPHSWVYVRELPR